jgi:hypothetical protein
MAAAGMAPIPTTCRAPIAATPNGRQTASGAGASIGPQTEGLVTAILLNRPHPEQGFRTCLGVLRLYRDLDPDHAEMVSARAVAIGALTYKGITAIIANRVVKPPVVETAGKRRGGSTGLGFDGAPARQV